MLCFDGRRDKLERIWQETFKKYGDDPQKSFEISVAALEEYPSDEMFLFRAALMQERLADLKREKDDKTAHLYQSMGYAKKLLEKDPQDEQAKELMVRVYSKLGLNDMAAEQAYRCKNADLALKFCLKGDALRWHRQKIMNRKIQELLWESQPIWTVVREQFKKAISNWYAQCPEEALGIGDDDLNGDGLVLNSLKISDANPSNYTYKIEAEYYKVFPNHLKAIYIVKFWDDLTIYDDVFYTER